MSGEWWAGRPGRLAWLSGVTFLLAALASELVVYQSYGLTSLWPANGILLGLLLVAGHTRAERGGIIAGALIGDLVASLIRHQPAGLFLLFPFANFAEAIGAWLIIQKLGGVSGAFDRIRDVVALIAGCVIAPLFSAAIGAMAIHLTYGAPFVDAWRNWYGAAALSLAIMAPTVVVMGHGAARIGREYPAGRRFGEAVLVLGLVAGAALVVFYGSRLPLLFVMVPFILLATFRQRQFGALASMAILAAIAARATAEGHGPIAMHSHGAADRLLFLQFFLATTFLSSLPVAAALNESARRGEEAHLLADHFRSVVENIGDVIFRTDRKGRWTYLNPAWEELSGYSVRDSVGRTWLDWIDEGERDEFGAWALPVLEGQVDQTRRLLRFRTRSGEVRWMELSIQALRHSHGHAVGTTGTLRDIDDRKKLEEHVMSAKRRAEEQAREATLLASTDELTGLANRRAFLRHLDRQVEAANEFGWSLAVAIFDVDHFKTVNDAHGHAMGDRVLQRVAERAVSAVRSGDLVGRLGGEEFAILMPGASPADATIVAERLRAIIERPCADGSDGALLPGVTVSIGVAAHGAQQDGPALLAEADRALYTAKRAGRNQVSIAA